MAKILIVDDEHLTVEMLGVFLRILGHEPIEAYSCRQARDRMAYQEVDLMLLDIMMPEMSGLEFCRELRSEPATQDLAIIMISAHSPPMTREAEEAGANHYLAKPINLQALQEMLATIGTL